MDQATVAIYYQKYDELKSKLNDYMVTLANSGNYIEAIKLHRYLFDSNLHDAKCHIKALLSDNTEFKSSAF